MQFGELLDAHLMNLVRRKIRGRGGLERPAIIFLAVGARPHSGDIGGDQAFGLQLCNLTPKGRDDFAGRDLSGPGFPIAAYALFLGPADQ